MSGANWLASSGSGDRNTRARTCPSPLAALQDVEGISILLSRTRECFMALVLSGSFRKLAQEYLVRARPILHSFHALGIALYRLALGTHCWQSAQYCDRQDYSKCRHSIPLMHQIQLTNFSISLAQRPGYCGQVVARVERSIAIPRKSCRSE